jgi:hypothetical protein
VVVDPEVAAQEERDREARVADVREGRSHQGKILVGGAIGAMQPFGLLAGEGADDEIHQGDFIATGFALGLDAGFAVASGTVIALWGEYAQFAGGECPSEPGEETECGPSGTWAIGPMLRQHFNVGGTPDVWAGIGFGYRELFLNVKTTGPGFERDNAITFSGIDWLHLALGLDFRLSDGWLLGPMLSLDGGQYTDVTAEGEDSEISETAMHYYAFLAIRLTFASQSLTVK